MCTSTTERYGSVWKTIHWLHFAMIAAIFICAWAGVFKWHIALGISTLLIVGIRIVWKIYDVRPELPLTVSRFDRIASRTVQNFMYVFMIAMPMSGWVMVNMKGRDVSVLDFFTMPKLVAENPEKKAFIVDMHVTAGYVFLAFIGLHLAGALYHHFIKKDRVLLMMWPFAK